METLWSWVVFLSFTMCFFMALWVVFQGLCHLFDFLWLKMVYPRRDAEQSYREFQEWQQAHLEDTPYIAPGRRGDPTRPDDDDGLSPLVEIWRRS